MPFFEDWTRTCLGLAERWGRCDVCTAACTAWPASARDARRFCVSFFTILPSALASAPLTRE